MDTLFLTKRQILIAEISSYLYNLYKAGYKLMNFVVDI